MPKRMRSRSSSRPRSSYKRRKTIMYKKKRSFKTRRFRKQNRGAQQYRMVTKLPYSEEIVVDAGANSYAVYTYSTNNLYDPDYTGTGHQPLGYDQISPLYKDWRVLKSSIRARMSPSAVSDIAPSYLAIVISDKNTAPTFSNQGHFLEYCKQHKIRVRTVGSFAQSLNTQSKTLVKAGWNARRGFGPGQDPQDQRGQITTSPLREQYFHIIAYSVMGNNPAALQLTVDIQYTAEFINQNILGQS